MFGLAIIIIAHALLINRLIFHPYPELFVYPYLVNKGLLPYQQIFDQHFPGLLFLPINLNNLGMTNEIVARWWLITLVVSTQILIYFITKKISGSKLIALLANLLYLIWQPFFEGWTLWIDSFMPLILLPAFYFSYQYQELRKIKYIFLAGVFLGLGIIFKQVIAPLVITIGIYFYLRHHSIKDLWWFLLGFLPVPILMVCYFYWLGIWQSFWFWTVTFNLTTFADFGRKSAKLNELIRMVFVYAPVSLVIFLEDNRALLLIYILGTLMFAYARFDFIHLQPSLPFIIIGSALLTHKLFKSISFKLMAVVYLLIMVILLNRFYQGHIGDKVLFFDSQMKFLAKEIRLLSKPDEQIYLFGPPANLYSMTETIPMGKVFVFQFPWFMMETERLFLQALQDNPPNLIVRDLTVEIEGRKITDYSSNINEFITHNYTTVEKIGNNEIMIKNKNEKNSSRI